MKNNCITTILKVAAIAAFSIILSRNAGAQTHVFISAMPRTNHLTDFSGTQPSSFQYKTMPISMNYALGIEQNLTPTFSVQLGLMRNTSKIVSKRYTGSNFDNGKLGYGTSRNSSLPWEVFLTLKQVVYRKNGFDLFVCAGASLILQPPMNAIFITTGLYDNNAITGRDTVMIIQENEFRRSDYLPFGAHAQIGVSKRFKNNITVSATAMLYYAKPIKNLTTTIWWENKVYESKAVQQTYFGGLNISLSYPFIKNRMKVFHKK